MRRCSVLAATLFFSGNVFAVPVESAPVGTVPAESIPVGSAMQVFSGMRAAQAVPDGYGARAVAATRVSEGRFVSGRREEYRASSWGTGSETHSAALALAQAVPRSSELLRALSSYIRSLGRYSVAFAVEVDDRSTAGRYSVEGERYHLRLAEAEVYGDGEVRYEVDHRRKEVAIDRVDAASRNILDNPTRAFDLVDDGFAPELLWEREGRAAVRLTPKAGQALSAVTVVLDTRSMRPLSLEYDFDGERIRIVVRSIEATNEAPAMFDPTEYRTYEIIDFR